MSIETHTFDMIDQIGQARSASAVHDLLFQALRVHGFESFLVAELPSAGSDFRDYVLLSGWPDGWFDLYMEARYYDSDPVAIHARNTVDPFYWSEIYKEVVFPQRSGPT